MQETILVTGGNGFVGMRLIFELLQKGYRVKTTLRSLSSKDEVLKTFKLNGITAFNNLSFVETDLSKDDNWDNVMAGCAYVLSVASPLFSGIPKDEEEAMRPAREGIIRILKAAREARVKRVVMTSNFGAVGFSNQNKNSITTEENWTNPDQTGLSIYEKSKLLAERSAWDFIKNEGGDLEFATINPVAILGPSLSEHVSGSFGLLKHLLDGSMKAIPNILLNVVDVRDVADLHIRAMTSPKANGQRFIASADGQISMPEIAVLLKNKMPQVAENISSKRVPNFVINVTSLFNKQAKEALLLLTMNRNVSNAKAKELLGWTPIASNEEAILASVESMIKYKIIK